MTAADVQKYIEMGRKSLPFLKLLAAVTPTKFDDQALDTVEKLLNVVEPIAGEAWFSELLGLVLGLFGKAKDDPDQMPRIMDVLRAA